MLNKALSFDSVKDTYTNVRIIYSINFELLNNFDKDYVIPTISRLYDNIKRMMDCIEKSKEVMKEETNIEEVFSQMNTIHDIMNSYYDRAKSLLDPLNSTNIMSRLKVVPSLYEKIIIPYSSKKQKDEEIDFLYKYVLEYSNLLFSLLNELEVDLYEEDNE